jgi:hypothetical protein
MLNRQATAANDRLASENLRIKRDPTEEVVRHLIRKY